MKARPRRFSRRYWLKLGIFTVTVSALAAAGLLVYAIYLQVYFFVTPHRNPHIDPLAPVAFNRPYHNITLTTADGLTISAWHIIGSKPQAIILVHGIDANRMAVLPEAAILSEAGYHLLLPDLRGHGLSSNAAVTYGYREAMDIQAAIDYLLAWPDVQQVAALGTSLGAAVVAHTAALDPRLKAIVLESCFSSLPAAVDDAFGSRSIFPRRPFGPLLVVLAEQQVGVKIGQISPANDLAAMSPRPVYIIHGLQDELFPPVHARRLFAVAPEPKTLWLIPNLGHGNPVVGREEEFKARIVPFFENAFSP